MKRTVYDADQESFRGVVREFIAREVVPVYPDWLENGAPRSLFHRLADLGVTGFGIPEEYGGPGAVSFKYHSLVLEEAARAGVALGHYAVSTGVVLPYLLTIANQEQKRRWLPGVGSGDIALCIAMTEPGTGSDIAGIRSSARLSDDESHYVLNGSKTFITGARNSELCVVVARTSRDDSERRGGLSLFVVPTDSAGLEIGRKLDKLGEQAIPAFELSFNDVRIPAENRLGEEGMAFTYLSRNLPRERLSIGVTAVATAAAAVDLARRHTQGRVAFGRPIAEFQNTKFVLAECSTEVEAAQAMVDKGLDLDDASELSPVDAAKIKLFCTEVAGRVIDRCLQLHGGYGFMLEYPIARLYADTRVSRIYGGTNEVMKTIIARAL